jgi:hypothetical protein
MSAIKDGRVPIILDKERHMLFSLNILDEIQDKFGGYDKLTEALRGKDAFKNVRWLLTRLINEGADDGEEEVSEAWTGKKIHAGNIKTVISEIFSAFNMGVTGAPEAGAPEAGTPDDEEIEDDDLEDDDEGNAKSGRE